MVVIYKKSCGWGSLLKLSEGYKSLLATWIVQSKDPTWLLSLIDLSLFHQEAEATV
ncbi:hypothetical protein BDY19DRAFT_922177 [Irpex rosettiformis]|uniref:Uncharacterized protein n=1 Tax=Irpex rosettiformis TaxID=378272 RepID=A0ACB8UFR2_9APHY|nr:hypothetical protein BDY19DRAFT_922177 [Irpex rosettiformis]